MHLLLVDDDPGLRALLRATLEVVDIDMTEAGSAREAEESLRTSRPDAIVLDVGMPVVDGLTFCAKLKGDAETSDIPIVLLTGADEGTADAAEAAGADAYVRKPFSPLELLSLVERLVGRLQGVPFRGTTRTPADEQLLLYARDLRHLLEIERGQRVLLQKAYHQTVTALATALESKDTGTRQHSQRVQRYAIELARALHPELADDQSTQYGFLLHDVGKIGIPDKILLKPRPLSEGEERLMRTHTVLGEQMLSGVAFLQGEGLRIVRHHHERWDGSGYPDRLVREEIPACARIFAVADALDAITSDRPYRPARAWEDAQREILAESGRQFDPNVVDAFRERESDLRDIQRELAAAA
ncbi:MAG: response regulator [Actinobacteria bacterium]|nr:response regulator [Actinomycetota bacterium]